MLSSYSFYLHCSTHSSKLGATQDLLLHYFSVFGVKSPGSFAFKRYLNLPFIGKAGFALLKPGTFRQHSSVVYLSVLFRISQNEARVLNKSLCSRLFSSSISSTVFLSFTRIVSKSQSCLGDASTVDVQVFNCSI